MDGFALRASDTAAATEAAPAALTRGRRVARRRALCRPARGRPGGEDLDRGDGARRERRGAARRGRPGGRRDREHDPSADPRPRDPPRRRGHRGRRGRAARRHPHRRRPSSGSPPPRARPSSPAPAGPASRSSSPGTSWSSRGAPLPPGAIRNTNGYAIPAQVAGAGGDGASRWRRSATTTRRRSTTLRRALAADVVVTTGGVSVGAHDHVKPALAELGVEEVFWGVALRPGHPTWFGTDGRGARLRPARETRSRRWSPSTCSCGPRLRACSASPAAERRATAVMDADYPQAPGPGPRGALHARRRATTDGTCGRRRSRARTCSRRCSDAEALALSGGGAGRRARRAKRVEIEIL